LIKIEVENLGKKFKTEWIFKNLGANFEFKKPTAIIGPNGSGKSTLMQVLANIIPQNTGSIAYTDKDKNIAEDVIFKKIAFSAPYSELIEEFTLTEALDFHTKFKPFLNNLSKIDFLEKVELSNHIQKQIKFFSSGMKQKLKLGLAFYDNSELLFLDEPTSNLDQNTSNWYLTEIQKLIHVKTIIISSNDSREYSFCENQINILNYKS
jgi:ABC-type multidrug transport system ATPase subunit